MINVIKSNLFFFLKNHIVISISFSGNAGRYGGRTGYRFSDQGAIADDPFYKFHTQIQSVPPESDNLY